MAAKVRAKILPACYWHYRSGREYVLETDALYHDDEVKAKLVVIYRDAKTGTLYATPYSRFFGRVELDGVEMPRFSPVEDARREVYVGSARELFD